MNNYKHPSYQIAETLKQIYNSRLTTTSGGNISIKEDDGTIWITPGAIDKGALSEKDIIKVLPDGSYEGLHSPSSEIPFHQAIYEIRPDIKAIIHAHPPALVAFSIVRKMPDTSIIPQAKHLCGTIGYAPYQMPGSKALGKNIATEFLKGYNAIIMENHGTVVGGKNLSDAFMRFETLEFCAKTIIKAKSIGNVNTLEEKDIREFEEHRTRLPEICNVVHTSKELFFRHQLCEIIKRACRQGLMISSYGTISKRLNSTDFIITPTNFNRREIQLRDFVLIEDGKQEPNKLPSKAVELHKDIYRKHPEIQCILSTQSPYATAFCVSKTRMDTRTIPESYILLEEIPLISYQSRISKDSEIADKLGRHTPIVLIENDSILVTGKSILETFDRLEVAEFSAKSLIDSSVIGDLHPIERHELEELKEKFLSD